MNASRSALTGTRSCSGDHPAGRAAALLELQLVIALDRIEGVGGRQHLERPADADLAGDAAKVGQMQLPPEMLGNEEAFRQFEQGQAELSGALGRLMVVVEQYPELRSNQNFLALQSQLEGTENRIAVARRDYVQAVQSYNTEVRTFPGRLWAMIYGAEPKANFTASAGAEQAPKVTF